MGNLKGPQTWRPMQEKVCSTKVCNNRKDNIQEFAVNDYFFHVKTDQGIIWIPINITITFL